MSKIDDRLKAIDTEREMLLAMKSAGTEDPKLAIDAQVTRINEYLRQVRTLADSFDIPFAIQLDDRKMNYSTDYNKFYSNDDYDGWSSSSLSC